ncbi:MAG: hypothetical protein J2P37_30920 [Ktedonobacteraceae bacterium]|nr:hypothetical protein [Ktedonobacteraceae bacterium]
MLRGYDPFREHLRWKRVLSLLTALALVVYVLALEALAYLEGHEARVLIVEFFGLGIAVVYLGIVRIVTLSSASRSLKRLRQQRMRALTGEDLPRTTPQPTVTGVPMDLPQHVHTRIGRGCLSTVIVLLIIFSLGLIWVQIPFFVADRYAGPDFASLRFALVFYTFILIEPLLNFSFSAIVTSHCLSPSLDIDENGITAYYERHTFTMAWHDIRYFAMTNTRQIARSGKKTTKPFTYEIGDGENMINWDPHIRIVTASKFDHPDYHTLASKQLPALIIERTGLPLLDLRLVR